MHWLHKNISVWWRNSNDSIARLREHLMLLIGVKGIIAINGLMIRLHIREILLNAHGRMNLHSGERAS